MHIVTITTKSNINVHYSWGVFQIPRTYCWCSGEISILKPFSLFSIILWCLVWCPQTDQAADKVTQICIKKRDERSFYITRTVLYNITHGQASEGRQAGAGIMTSLDSSISIMVWRCTRWASAPGWYYEIQQITPCRLARQSSSFTKICLWNQNFDLFWIWVVGGREFHE